MGKQLKYYFKNHSLHVNQLKKLLKETEDALSSIEKSRNLNCEHLKELQFTSDEIEELKNILYVPICIVITGQTFYSKLVILTKLLGEQIIQLFNFQKKKNHNIYYPIKVCYGTERKVQLRDIQKPLEELTLEDLFNPTKENENGEDFKKVEIRLPLPLLESGLEIFITPSYSKNVPKSLSIRRANEFLHHIGLAYSSIVFYGISQLTFTQEERAHLRALKELKVNIPILFVRIPHLLENIDCDLPESEQHNLLCKLAILKFSDSDAAEKSKTRRIDATQPDDDAADSNSEDEFQDSTPKQFYDIPESLLFTLCDKIGCLKRRCPPQNLYERFVEGELKHYNDWIDGFEDSDRIRNFLSISLSGPLVKAAGILHESHSRCMRMFILFAFDTARETQITPLRIAYAKEKENELYENLIAIASKKQEEINTIIRESLDEVQEDLLKNVAEYQFKDVELPESGEDVTSKDIRCCTVEIQDYVLAVLNESVGRNLAQRLRMMRSSYLGTLRRCLETLENDCRVSGESTNVGDTLKQMMNAAYQLDISSSVSSSSLRSFFEMMKLLVTAIPGRGPPCIDEDWKKRVAQDVLGNLSESKLSKVICTQLRDALKFSHDSFVVSMRELEAQLTARLGQKEESQLKIKKFDAPRMARMSLESTSIKDSILFGMPKLGREIGRGQYGVVFGCHKWGGFSPCAVKSLVPLDDRHWDDLAMEFHYTRSIPEHERIVSLRGSVIDYSYGQCETPAVLLVMERLSRDLHSGIKRGLDWPVRLKIAVDVTQGIRYLHSQGLIHRDIKLKNVLLDSVNRGKLTDLGFCKPEAMISGSIVGTPIHMAPELFSGSYDNSVDVYAFGVLFWYICAGHVKLPLTFDQCHSKDQLWQSVRKGVRPEKLNTFSGECWDLMNECWDASPAKRPFLGNVEPRLEKMLKDVLEELRDIKAADSATEEPCRSPNRGPGNANVGIEYAQDALKDVNK